MKITDIITAIVSKSYTSAWNRGVSRYALRLLHDLLENGETEYHGSAYDHKRLLNGASDWKEYSYGGCALINDGNIAERLCTPSELRRTDYGRRNPNSRENWLDCQARALRQAVSLFSSVKSWSFKSDLPPDNIAPITAIKIKATTVTAPMWGGLKPHNLH